MDKGLMSVLSTLANVLKCSEVKEIIKRVQISKPSPHSYVVINVASARDFLFSLVQRKLITTEDSSFLKNILNDIGRKDLSDLLSHHEASETKQKLKNLGTKLDDVTDRIKNALRESKERYKPDAFKHSQDHVLREADLEKTNSAAFNSTRESLPQEIHDKIKLTCYKMDAEPRGRCLIIDNEIFSYDPNDKEATKLENRTGSSVDCENLIKTFTECHFEVTRLIDPTDEDIRKELKYLSVQSMWRSDCLVICILSHGGYGFFYGSNGRKVREEELINYFCAKNCPSLEGKPKLILLSCCRLKGSQPAAQTEPVNPVRSDGPQSSSSFKEVDFIFIYGTTPGSLAYRSHERGTFFIDVFTQVMEEDNGRELQQILIEVNRRVAAITHVDPNDHIKKQMPKIEHTLRKSLYLKKPKMTGDKESRLNKSRTLALPATPNNSCHTQPLEAVESSEKQSSSSTNTGSISSRSELADEQLAPMPYTNAQKMIECIAAVTNLTIAEVRSCFNKLKQNNARVTNCMLLDALRMSMRSLVLEDAELPE